LYSKKSTFSKDLCQTLLFANIPLNKVNNKNFRLFLEKCTKKEILDERTLRKSYVNDIYVETMNKIRSNIAGHKIWVSVDKTTDVQGYCQYYYWNIRNTQTGTSLPIKLGGARENKLFNHH
jgi:hypothetical protein